MDQDDPITGGDWPNPTRPYARKFTSRNLTATNLNAQVDRNDGTTFPSVNLSKFTDYPTQGGAYFQWANNTNKRFAWDCSTPEANIYGWTTTTTSIGVWNSSGAEHESCPPGYHRPNDGSITANQTSVSVSVSEFRQSLILAPKGGTSPANHGTANSVWGYYADGFFDRRQITGNTSLNTNPGAFPDAFSTVAANTDEAAYVGRLLFNSIAGSNHYNASIFFPAAGSRSASFGTTYLQGRNGIYWSSSTGNGSNGWEMEFLGIGYYIAFNCPTSGGSGNSIRCVKD